MEGRELRHRAFDDPSQLDSLEGWTVLHPRLRAAEVLLQRGWGDKPRLDNALPEGVTIVVQKLTAEGAVPVRGVLASPVQGNVWPDARSIPASAETIDAAAQELPAVNSGIP